MITKNTIFLDVLILCHKEFRLERLGFSVSRLVRVICDHLDCDTLGDVPLVPTLGSFWMPQ